MILDFNFDLGLMVTPEQLGAGTVLLLAAVLDYLIADPDRWLHPVQVMGWIIARLTQIILSTIPNPRQRRYAGIGLGLLVILGTGLASWFLLWGLEQWHSWLGWMVEVILLASGFAGRSLYQATNKVLKALQQGEIALARNALSQFVGRDTEELDESAILRATLESWAENSVDGVMAPLFYAILGLWLPWVGSVPLVLSYKAASTLDSMIGYLREPYRDLGWFSARFEDYLTWWPCRLTVLTLALLSGKPRRVLAICRRDGPQDPSPNSGWSEAVYAAILGVQLGGENSYQGVKRLKPLLGEPDFPITVDKIQAAIALTRLCFLLWLAIGVVSGYCLSLI